ncbi:MAG: dTMP kinase [Nocardioidaceae bacterium]|nr:dTMP kinase [Nocardioidaceae bacterium]
MSTAPHSVGAVLALPGLRRFWAAIGLSSLGDWVGLLALTALANELAGAGYADRNFAIAGVLLLRVLPALLIGPLGGYLADHLDRRKVLVVGDVLRAVLFVTIPLVGTLPWLLVATVLVEVVNLVWLPTKDATIPDLVPPSRLEAANRLVLATTYGSALPAAALFIGISLVTEALSSTTGWAPESSVTLALLANALSFAVSAVLLLSLGPALPAGAAVPQEDRVGVVRAVVDGWAYVARTPLIRSLVVGIAGAFAAGGVVIGLARVYVAELGAGDPGYGVLFGAVFAGLGGGMWAGPRLLGGVSRRRLFGLALAGAGVVLVGLSLVSDMVLAAVASLLLGSAAGVAWITGYTLLGLEVPEALRGRTFALVQSLVRLVLALVLAAAPLLAGLAGAHRLRINDDVALTFGGVQLAFAVAGLLAAGVGVASFRSMNDRPGVSVTAELRQSMGGRGVYPPRGVFIALEGGEGAGKSTQARLLADALSGVAAEVVLTREPGGTAVGRSLRDILLDPVTGELSPRTEALLYAADKAEHVARVVRPALDRGAVVITDRYVDSTLAYQGAGRALPVDEVEQVARWATEQLRPHLTVFLDLPAAEGLRRALPEASPEASPDRLEQEPADFHERVRGRFRALAAADPDHYLIVDATLAAETVAATVLQQVGPLVGPRH